MTPFPILRPCGKEKTYADLGIPQEIPWALVAAHNNQCLRNHYQNAQRLADRGGLNISELVAVLEDRPYKHLTDVDAAILLEQLVKRWHEATNIAGTLLNAVVAAKEAAMRPQLPLSKDGKAEAAPEEFRKYIEAFVENPEAHGGLAWLQDNGIEAIEMLLKYSVESFRFGRILGLREARMMVEGRRTGESDCDTNLTAIISDLDEIIGRS